MIMNRALIALGALSSTVSYAQVYMNELQAVASIFPDKKLQEAGLTLTDTQKKHIESTSGITVRQTKLRLWKSPDKTVVFVDQVLGKHELITYAVGINEKREVQGVEILEYKESYGQNVRGNWRKQFLGKTKAATLKLDNDIKNLSGATLSSSHLTDGIKRLLITYDAISEQL